MALHSNEIVAWNIVIMKSFCDTNRQRNYFVFKKQFYVLLLLLLFWVKSDKWVFHFWSLLFLSQPDKILTLRLSSVTDDSMLPLHSNIYSRGIVVQTKTWCNQSKTLRFLMRSMRRTQTWNICFQLSTKVLLLCIYTDSIWESVSKLI